MSKSGRLGIVVPIAAIFAAVSLSAMADQPKPPKPGPVKTVGHPPLKGPNAGFKAPKTGGAVGMHHRLDRDRNHWDQRRRDAWAHGRAYPYGCRFGRCGYWWWADGYWYYYLQPLEGPPDFVSEDAYPGQQGEPDQPPAPMVPVPYGVPVPVVPLPCIGPLCL
jgi:hypothetical protein